MSDMLLVEREWKLRFIRLLSAGLGLAGARLLLNPKLGFQMAKNKRLFEDEKDERVIFAKELIRWTGLFMLMVGWSTSLYAKLDPITKELPHTVIYVLRVLGALFVVDGVYVKYFGFHGSNVFTHNDSVVTSGVDVALGLLFLSIK